MSLKNMMMGSPSGNYHMCLSNTRLLQGLGCEQEDEIMMLERKRKRMEANRESARRSRKKKQKYVDDMMAQVVGLRKQNNELVAGINMVRQMHQNVEAENIILKAQIVELTQNLQSLNHIIDLVNARKMMNTGSGEAMNFAVNPMDMFLSHNQPIVACADMFNQW